MNIKKLRVKVGLTQKELSKKLGYKHQSAIGMMETGKRNIPSDKIPILAEALGCEIKDLFE